jgi:glycosyltransferase involved in cell wall biosynthesis
MAGEGDLDDVTVIVPAFNEATSIGGVVANLRAHFARVVVVDDASTDATAAIAGAAGAQVLRHSVNLGQGAALQTGFDHARTLESCAWVVTFDADGQHQVVDALEMVRIARSTDVDVVLASRFTGTARDIPRRRAWILRAAVRFTRWTAGIPVTDAHNGLRVINTRVLNRLRITLAGMAHASELLGLIARHQLRFIEVPTTVIYSDYSRAKSQTDLNAINIVFELALARLRA